MSSTKFILIFLGFIFLILLLFSSRRLAGIFRERFGTFFPQTKVTVESITPTPSLAEPTPTPTVFASINLTSTPAYEIPATGPFALSYLLFGGSLALGVWLKKSSRF